MAFFISLHCREKRWLATRASAAFSAARLVAQIHIINLHRSRMAASVVSLMHHLHQFVSHVPNGVVGDVLFSQVDQIHGLRPGAQRQLGGFENGAGDDRGLAVTAIALVEFADVEQAASLVATVRAGEACKPTLIEQRLVALLVSSVEFVELAHCESFLELYWIALPRKYTFTINSLIKLDLYWN